MTAKKQKSPRSKKSPASNVVYVRHDHPQSCYPAKVIRKRAFAFMERLGIRGSELSITLTDDERIAAINGEWRQKPVPTDVLSFPAGEMPAVPGLPAPLGDIVISLDTARRRCAEEGTTLGAEVSRYLAHGLLHLTGWDHHRSPEEAREMLAREEALLEGIGKGMLHDSEELE